MMIWSSTGISNSLPASATRLVQRISNSLGWESPEGWLWTMTIPQAFRRTAEEKNTFNI